jgi:hypothetical protein
MIFPDQRGSDRLQLNTKASCGGGVSRFESRLASNETCSIFCVLSLSKLLIIIIIAIAIVIVIIIIIFIFITIIINLLWIKLNHIKTHTKKMIGQGCPKERTPTFQPSLTPRHK